MIQSATTYPAILGRILSGLREGLGLNQAEVAEAVGVTQSTWSKIERGDSTLSLDQLRAASRFLHTTPGTILDKADDAVAELEARGLKVHGTRIDVPAAPGFALISGAALAVLLGAVVGALIASTQDDEEEEPAPKKRKSKAPA
jgi:transcriptional regulator with XRE-family HTH domain